MAKVNKLKFVNTLKLLNLDFEEFGDCSFDGLCDEPSLQLFLQWICDSFDRDNILTDDEESDYNFLRQKGAQNELFDSVTSLKIDSSKYLIETVDVLQARLLQEKNHLSICMSHEEILCKGENEFLTSVRKESLEFLDFISTATRITCHVECALKSCLTSQLYLPEFDSLHFTIENLNQYLHDISKTAVFPIVDMLTEEIKLIEPLMPDVKKTLDELYLDLGDLQRDFNPNDEKNANKSSSTDSKQSAVNKTNNYLLKTETLDLRRKFYAYNALCIAQKILNDISLQNFTTATLERVQLLEKSKMFSQIFNLISEFIKNLEFQIAHSVHIMSRVRERLGNDNCIEDNSTDNRQFFVSIENLCHPFWKSSSELEHLYRTLKQRVDTSLDRLHRCPTKRFCSLSPEVVYLMNDCRTVREKTEKDIKHLTGRCVNVTGVLQHEDSLLWASFIVDPTQLMTHSKNRTPMSTPLPRTSQNQSIFDLSQLSTPSASFFFK